MIPFIDFGGDSPLLHLAHANGFPPAAYAPLAGTLAPHYHVLSMLARPLWPDTPPDGLNSWDSLTDDFLKFLDERGTSRLVGVGHSLGAITTLLAALRRPDVFRAVVLLDPVLFPPLMSAAWGAFKRVGLGHRVHPLVGSTQRRRRVFESVDLMFERYRRAPVFRRMDDPALRAYVESLARSRPDGQVELNYSPEWEVKIYVTAPHDLWSHLKNLRPPLLVVWGEQSDTFFPAAARALQKIHPAATYQGIPNAGHLVPLEKPQAVGEAIRVFLSKIEA
jgi:pimeloyl-ACP methyl ester carboxylesterase